MLNILKKIYERFIKIRGTPREIALGFALGLFIGLSPTMGIQIVVGIFLASVLKWNKSAAAIGVLVTNPLTAPFIYSMTYIVGAKVLRIENSFDLKDNFDWTAFIDLLQNSPGIITSLFVGGAIVGIPTAMVGYIVAFNAVEKYQSSLKNKIKLQKEILKAKVRQRAQHKAEARQGRKGSAQKDV